MALRQISGTFNGTGADIYVGLGFVPDWVEIMSLETTDEERQYWDRDMRSAEMFGGYTIDDDGAFSPVTIGAGIAEYLGGNLVTAASTVYLQKYSKDQRDAGSGGVISRWILDTPGSRTGHFDNPVNTTYVGEGSIVQIGKEAAPGRDQAVILALSNDGDAADEVTLSKDLGTNEVLYISRMYDYWGVSANTVMSPGFFLDSTAAVNTSGDMLRFRAGTFD
jgi:hypothetical protein